MGSNGSMALKLRHGVHELTSGWAVLVGPGFWKLGPSKIQWISNGFSEVSLLIWYGNVWVYRYTGIPHRQTHPFVTLWPCPRNKVSQRDPVAPGDWQAGLLPLANFMLDTTAATEIRVFSGPFPPLCTVLPNQPFVAMGGAASTAGAVAAGVGKMKEGELQRSSRVEGWYSEVSGPPNGNPTVGDYIICPVSWVDRGFNNPREKAFGWCVTVFRGITVFIWWSTKHEPL